MEDEKGDKLIIIKEYNIETGHVEVVTMIPDEDLDVWFATHLDTDKSGTHCLYGVPESEEEGDGE